MPTEKKVQFNRSVPKSVLDRWVAYCQKNNFKDNDKLVAVLLKEMKGE